MLGKASGGEKKASLITLILLGLIFPESFHLEIVLL